MDLLIAPLEVPWGWGQLQGSGSMNKDQTICADLDQKKKKKRVSDTLRVQKLHYLSGHLNFQTQTWKGIPGNAVSGKKIHSDRSILPEEGKDLLRWAHAGVCTEVLRWPSKCHDWHDEPLRNHPSGFEVAKLHLQAGTHYYFNVIVMSQKEKSVYSKLYNTKSCMSSCTMMGFFGCQTESLKIDVDSIYKQVTWAGTSFLTGVKAFFPPFSSFLEKSTFAERSALLFCNKWLCSDF